MGKLRKLTKVSAVSLAVLLGIVLLGLSLPIAGWRTFSVQTGSMQPAIDPGHLVIVEPVAPERLIVGDVITFLNPNNKKQTITHRFIGTRTSPMGSEQLITKGDANDTADTPISPSLLVGRVSISVPLLGKVSSFIKSPAGLLLLIYIPALVVITSETKRLTQYYRSIKRYVLVGYKRRPATSNKLAVGIKSTLLAAVVGVASIVPITHAALKSSVTLTGNTITTAAVPQTPPPTNTCTVTNSNSVNVNVTSNQSASSGDATSSGNTTTGNVSSGAASNSNSTTVTVNSSNSSTSCNSNSQP